MIAAGRLRHRVAIQRPQQVQDPVTGALTPIWVPVADVWAEIVPLSAREFVAAQAMNSEVSTRITIRRRADVDSTCRILHGGVVYNIAGVLADPVSGREYLTLPCSTGANDG